MMRRPPRSSLFPSTTPFHSLTASHAWVTGARDRSSGAEGPPILVGTQPGSTAFDRTDGQRRATARASTRRSEEHTSELQSRQYLVCRHLLEKKSPLLGSPDH